MTSKKKRAFHFGGASWLLLCAMADGAMAQNAAAPSASTPLPEITVTAPSPIVRRRAVVPSRTPVRVARTAPGRTANARRRTASRAGCTRASTRRAAHRDRSIRDGHGGAQRGDPPPRHRPAWRSPVLEARHYRLQLCARRLQPAGHPRPRCQPRRHRRKRHQRWRRLRSWRRPFCSGRSTGDKPGRSHPRTGGDAIRIDIDRRRRQRNQQSHPGCTAHLRRGAIPELWTAREGAAGERAIIVMRKCRNPNGRQFRRPGCRWRHPARCRRRQFCDSMPTPMAAKPAITASRAIPICSTRPGRSTAGSRIRRCRRMVRRSAALTSSRAASSARRSRRTTRSIAFPASTAPITRRGSTRHQTKFTAKGEYRPDAAAIDAVTFLGGRHRLST